MITAYSSRPLPRHFESAPPAQPTMTMAELAELESREARKSWGSESAPDALEVVVTAVEDGCRTADDVAEHTGFCIEYARIKLAQGVRYRLLLRTRERKGGNARYVYTIANQEDMS